MMDPFDQLATRMLLIAILKFSEHLEEKPLDLIKQTNSSHSPKIKGRNWRIGEFSLDMHINMQFLIISRGHRNFLGSGNQGPMGYLKRGHLLSVRGCCLEVFKN